MNLGEGDEVEFKKPDVDFPGEEYAVFVIVLIASLGIGVFYGFFGNKNRTNEEFLMAGRQMSILPVTLSLLCSFVSAITLLGNPVEVYFYGTQNSLMAVSFIPLTLILMFILVPVFFRLQLTSAYEYFEWRFSRRVRLTLSVFAMIHLCFYMPTTVYGPSLALDQVAGLNTIGSCAAIFLVCIAYSSLGGLKAVLWTDALQAVVMYVALGAIIIAGMLETGSISYVWEQATKTERIDFFITDIDIRSRHTFWTAMIGALFTWLPLFAATQAQIQRYNAVPTLRQARICLLFNMVGLMLIIFLCGWVGLMLFAKYHDCDPVKANLIKSPDQLLPLFAIEVLKDYPGIPGLLVAGLTCGSLSSVSSALNSLTAIITEDFVKPRRPDLSEERLATVSKVISTISGLTAFALVFAIAEVNKTVQISPFATLLHGALLGPILAAFFLGMFFPWTNELGILLALISSVALSTFVGLGNIFSGRAGVLPDQKLTLRTDSCTLTNGSVYSDHPFDYEIRTREDWKEAHEDDSLVLKLWSISYVWQPALGVFSTLFLGLIFSGIILAFQKKPIQKVNESLLSTPFVTLWGKIFGQKYLDKWIDFKSPPFSGNPAAKRRRNIEIALENEKNVL